MTSVIPEKSLISYLYGRPVGYVIKLSLIIRYLAT